MLAKIYKQALTKHGYAVLLAHDAQTAVTVLDNSERCDLIILELQLVEHGGVEFVYELRSYSEWQELPIIIHTMVSPNSLGLTKTFFRNYGIVEYLYKPATSIKTLLEVVDNCLLVKA